jgi:hypothetical protein
VEVGLLARDKQVSKIRSSRLIAIANYNATDCETDSKKLKPGKASSGKSSSPTQPTG